MPERPVQESSAVRLVLVALVVVLLAVGGLVVYGMTLKPDVRTIEQDAIGSAHA